MDKKVMIQLFQPTTDHRERIAIGEVLNSRWIGKGPRVTAFEAAWAKHVGAQPEHMVSTNSCTQALFEAVRLCDLDPGDEVIIPSVHFLGAAQAVCAAGATPVFCDVDSDTLNTTDRLLAQKVTGRTRAVILNHYGGVLAPLDRTLIPRDVLIIDDLACAPMATLASVGRCDYATFSFDSMKVITTGDGGMLWCADAGDAVLARQDFSLGASTASGMSAVGKKPQWWEFYVDLYGQGRSLMNDTQAAMGLVQLDKLPGLVARRLELANLYRQIMTSWTVPNGVLMEDPISQAYYFFWVSTPSRDALAAHLFAHDIYTSMRYYPLHLAYKTKQSLPGAERAARETLNLPLHANLEDEDVEFICKTIQEFYVRH